MSSRWLEMPAHVTENAGRPAGGLPRGGRRVRPEAVGRDGPRPDGLLVAGRACRAARFTRSGVLAAPVVLTKERTRLDALRVIVANSGNANAATGNRGFEDAARMQGARGDGRRRAARTRSRSPPRA